LTGVDAPAIIASDEGDSIEVEAEGFEEASHLMFGDGEYDHNEWRLVAKDGQYF
jgi:hypothetical protein